MSEKAIGFRKGMNIIDEKKRTNTAPAAPIVAIDLAAKLREYGTKI